MANLSIKAKNLETGESIPGAQVDVVFRGKIFGQGYNTGTASKTADAEGVAVFQTPLFTDHANVTVTSIDGYYGTSQVPVQLIDTSWLFLVNPIGAFASAAVATTIPVDLTTKPIETETTKQPLRVAIYRGEQTVGKIGDAIVKNAITIIVSIVAVALIIYALKSYGGPIAKWLGKGKKIFKPKEDEKIVY